MSYKVGICRACKKHSHFIREDLRCQDCFKNDYEEVIIDEKPDAGMENSVLVSEIFSLEDDEDIEA